MAFQRTHLLLEPEQQKSLSEIAQREGRSVSDVAREIIQQGITHRQQQYKNELERRLAALENIRRVRKSIEEERGGADFIDVVDLIMEMREERDANILGRCG